MLHATNGRFCLYAHEWVGGNCTDNMTEKKEYGVLREDKLCGHAYERQHIYQEYTGSRLEDGCRYIIRIKRKADICALGPGMIRSWGGGHRSEVTLLVGTKWQNCQCHINGISAAQQAPSGPHRSNNEGDEGKTCRRDEDAGFFFKRNKTLKWKYSGGLDRKSCQRCHGMWIAG